METVSKTLNYSEMPNIQPSNEKIVKCPTCKERLPEDQGELERHFELEKERLQEIKLEEAAEELEAETPNSEAPANSGESSGQNKRPWSIYQKVRRNRQLRQRQRTRKRSSPPPPKPQHQICPLCNGSYSQDTIQAHVEKCLRRANANDSAANDHSSNDEDDLEDEVYEEYEWAGQKRIRTSSLIQGGYASLGIGQSIVYNKNNGNCEDDEDEDLNVDEDDTQIYGPPQYGETDVISPGNEEGDDTANGDITSYMRHLISANKSDNQGRTDLEERVGSKAHDKGTSHGSNKTEVASTSANVAIAESSTALPSSSNKKRVNGSCDSASLHSQQIIDALKNQIKQYEKAPASKWKCLICLDDYRSPAISVNCWHVHCEECWLRSLGARKLCPQCNLITTPKDLRRIYL